MKLITTKEQIKDISIHFLNKRYGNLKLVQHEINPNYVFFLNPKDDTTIMIYNTENHILSVNYYEIWDLLENIFKHVDFEIIDILEKWVKERYNLVNVIVKIGFEKRES